MSSEEDLKAEIETASCENDALKKPARGQMSLKVSERAACLYTDLVAFPSHSTEKQWEKVAWHGRRDP